MKEQSPSNLKKLRESFMNLLINGVPPDVIIVNLVKEFSSKNKNDHEMAQIINAAAFYDNRMQNGSKTLFHLEALVAKIMFIIADNK